LLGPAWTRQPPAAAAAAAAAALPAGVPCLHR
jgi:hypothetical protein